MASTTNILGALAPVALIPATSLTANTNGTGVDVSAYDGVALVTVDLVNTAGTNPTADIKLQHSDTSGGTYTDISGAAITQVTTALTSARTQLALDVSATKKFVRAVFTIGGTSSPAWTTSVLFIGAKKYQ